MSPALSASRMRLDDTGSPSSAPARPSRRRSHARAPSVAQQRDVAAAALAEGEVLAGHDARGADALDQPSATNSSAASRGERRVEVEHQHRVGAGLGEQPLALVERGQPERRRVGPEIAHRVRIEGRDDRRPPLGARCDRAADHRLVAEVEAVEIAERDDASPEASGMPPAKVSRCIAPGLSGSGALEQPVFVEASAITNRSKMLSGSARSRACSCSVQLVGDEQPEHGEARRIGPQFLLQQPNDQHAFTTRG